MSAPMMGPKRPWSLTQELPLELAVLGAWLAGFGAAALLEYAPNASLWFPPAGIAFAAVLVLGRRALPVLFLGCFQVTILADQVYERGQTWSELLLAGAAFAISHALIYGLAAILLRSRVRLTPDHLSQGDILAFLLIGLVASGVSSALAGISMVALGTTQPAEAAALIRTWWIGDYAGLVTVAPLVAVLLSHLSARLQARATARFDRVDGLDRLDSLWTSALPGLATLLVAALLLLAVPVFLNQLWLVYGLLLSAPIMIRLAKTEAAIATVAGVFGLTLLVASAVSSSPLRQHALDLQLIVIALAAISYLALTIHKPRRLQVKSA